MAGPPPITIDDGLHPGIPRLIKIDELATMSGLGEPVIREMIRTGDIKAVRISKRIERVVLQSYQDLMTRLTAGESVNPHQAIGFVYFITDDKRRVKIGYSADPHRRLRGMQTGSGSRLHLLAMIPGCIADERDMHERFARYRVHLEWFRFAGKLRAFVDGLANG